MDISTTPIAERIARVLAAEQLSENAAGDQPSASAQVDACWHDYLPHASAVLKTLREPDRAMAAAGDVAVWEAMILAGLKGAVPPKVVL